MSSGESTWDIHGLILWCTSSNTGPRKTVINSWNKNPMFVNIQEWVILTILRWSLLTRECYKGSLMMSKVMTYLSIRFYGKCAIWAKDICSRGLKQQKPHLWIDLQLDTTMQAIPYKYKTQRKQKQTLPKNSSFRIYKQMTTWRSLPLPSSPE